MAKTGNDLTGRRYGKLFVAGKSGMTTYGGRQQMLWECVCDCGAIILLPTAKLPCTEGEIRAAERAGRRLYTSCEVCREKTCPLCYHRFSYSHPSHICPDPLCQEELRRLRDAYWHGITKERYSADPAYRQQVREYHSDYWKENGVVMRRAREARIAAMPPDEQNAYIARLAEHRASIYARIKNDPSRYEARMDNIRRKRTENALAVLLSTGGAIEERLQNPPKSSETETENAENDD